MKLLASLTILGLVMAQSVTAQTNYTKDPESCTSIMVGKKATTRWISYNQSYMRQLVPNLGKHGSGRKL